MNIHEDLLENFSRLKLSDANEAETRKKLIDKVLEDVLSWKEADITYEERVSEDGNSSFADYIVRTANTSFVVEAKRIGTSFLEVPKKRRIKLNSAFLRGETGDAIRQVRNYCRSKSIPYAVVTNGDQWIVFPATRTDGVEFSSSHAIVFDSLEQVLVEEFDFFVSILSRNGVIEGNLDVELIGRSEDQIEERRLNNFHTASNGKEPNPIYPLIENAVLAAFSDTIVNGDSDLLEKCYVKNADRMKFDNKIKMHLSKREPLFDSQPKRPLRKREASALEDSLKTTIEKARPLAILILGTVGAGKTGSSSFHVDLA